MSDSGENRHRAEHNELERKGEGLNESVAPQPTYDPTSNHNHARASSASSSSGSHLSPFAQPFALPNIPAARQSASSLMDAIFGQTEPPAAGLPHSSLNASAAPYVVKPSPVKAYIPPSPAAPIQFKRKPKKGLSRTSSARTSQADTESWDVLSDADSRLNEDRANEEGEAVAELQKRGEVVDALQKKVDRRKSQLPQLESELALLEAQIKAAEERLARVQISQRSDSGGAL